MNYANHLMMHTPTANITMAIAKAFTQKDEVLGELTTDP